MSRDFWKTFGKAGIQNEKKQQIPWQIVNSDNSISYDPNIVLEKWKSKFEQLLNPEEGIVRATPGEMLGDYPVIQDTTTLNADITIEEVRFALTSASKEKALGVHDHTEYISTCWQVIDVH